MKTFSRAAKVAVVLSLCLIVIVFQIGVSSSFRFFKNYATPYSANTAQEEDTLGGVELVSLQDAHPLASQRFPTKSPIICDRTSTRYDSCFINSPTVMDPTTLTLFTTRLAQHAVVEKVQPYPRKFDKYMMPSIKNFTLSSGPESPLCNVQHKVPALVFNAGGLIGNFFHDFDDGFIPLFITVNTIYRDDQEFVIVVSDAPKWWPSKYAEILHTFTKHPIISLRDENDTPTHCFPSATIGLISHGFMTINQTLLPNSKTFMDFRVLLDQAYTRKSQPVKILASESTKFRPRLVLASRKEAKERLIVNRDQLISLIKKVGFDVIVFEPKTKTPPMNESYALLNSSHAFIGVHGAALTHSLFLRPGSVFVQVVPIGLEWVASAFFGRIAKGLNLQYFEYKIGVDESTLVDKYGKENLLLRDPFALTKRDKTGWPKAMDIYLHEQNVKLNLTRFEECLKKAYEKAKEFMEKNS